MSPRARQTRSQRMALVTGVLCFMLTLIVLQLWLVLSHGGWQFMTQPGEGVAKAASNTEALGLLTYTQYLYPLQVAGCILLVAIIAAIALTLRRRKDSKFQRPSEQVKVRRADRVRLVQMDAERRQPDSPAAQKNVKPGDVIVEVTQEKVTQPQDVKDRLLAVKRSGRRSVLLLLSDAKGELRFVAVPTS